MKRTRNYSDRELRRKELVQIKVDLQNESLYPASSYLRIPKGSRILQKGNLHSFCRVPPRIKEKNVQKRPCFFKRLVYTFI